MRTLIIIVVCFSCLSCHNYFYHVSYADQTFFNTSSTITLDDSYEYYIRKVFKKDSSSNQKIFLSNLRADEGVENLIEIEYLLISKKRQCVIYLTMVQDKKQKFYKEHYMGDNYLNGYDFRNFLFGKLNGDSVIFTSKSNPKSKDLWTLAHPESNPDVVLVTNILQIKNGEFLQSLPVDRAIEKNIGFVKISRPALIYHNPDNKNDEKVFPSADNKMYLFRWRSGLFRAYKWRIHFAYEEQGKKFWIYFKGTRYPYTPDANFD